MCYPLALSVWSDELSGDNLDKFFISSCCQCSLQSSLKPSAENVWSGLQVNFGRGTKHFCMSDFCFIFCENGHNYSEQRVAAPYHTSIFFFSKHSDCRSHFLDIPYQCMFINCICLSSLSFFEVFIFLHINCLFSLFFMVCPNPKYLATLHISFVLVDNTCSCLLQLF